MSEALTLWSSLDLPYRNISQDDGYLMYSLYSAAPLSNRLGKTRSFLQDEELLMSLANRRPHLRALQQFTR